MKHRLIAFGLLAGSDDGTIGSARQRPKGRKHAEAGRTRAPQCSGDGSRRGVCGGQAPRHRRPHFLHPLRAGTPSGRRLHDQPPRQRRAAAAGRSRVRAVVARREQDPGGPDCCAERILNPDDGSYTELPTFYPDLGLFLGCNVWSPDSARLACEGFGDQPSADGVYTIRSSDSGDVRRVTSGADDDYPGDYSPNGKRIVFLRSSFDAGPIALDTAKLDGSDLRQLTPPGMGMLLDFTGGSWSPQGNEILFSASPSKGQRSAVFVVHADGSGLRRIPIPGCGTTAGCHEPVWSPDGEKIAFTMVVAQTGLSDLYTVNPDGTGPQASRSCRVGCGPEGLGHASAEPLGHGAGRGEWLPTAGVSLVVCTKATPVSSPRHHEHGVSRPIEPKTPHG